jgi:hypothetical protein
VRTTLEPSAAQRLVGDIAPKLAELTGVSSGPANLEAVDAPDDDLVVRTYTAASYGITHMAAGPLTQGLCPQPPVGSALGSSGDNGFRLRPDCVSL